MTTEGFHLDKTINIGHIVTTLAMVFSLIWWASTVESRIAVHATQINAAEKQSEANRVEIKDTLRDIREELRYLTRAIRGDTSSSRSEKR